LDEEVRVAEVVVGSTTWLTSWDVLGAFMESPLYTAIRGYVPALSIGVVRVATDIPLRLLLRVADPMVKRSHMNLTLPVGVEKGGLSEYTVA
jgi:hypothetical protein